MDYRRFSPSGSSADVVEHYWSVIAPAPPAALRAVLVPNGRATVQFCLGTPGTRAAVGVAPEPNADVYLPVSTEPLVIEQEGASHYVGVQCTPWGGRALFPHVRQGAVQVEEALGRLPEKSALAADPADALDGWVQELRPPTVPRQQLLAAATARIDADPSGVEVHHLHQGLGVSASTLYRAFRHGIGLSPKRYIQVMRHRAFTDRLVEDAPGEPAALMAALAGYADQSHASREFSRFTGMTASAFRDTYDGIARLMARPG